MVLAGTQFGDEIIPFITGVRKLRLLDIHATSISLSGVNEMKSKMLKRTRVWYPEV
jgi:hypothetical protein